MFACKRPRGSQGLAPGLSLPIILTLLSMIIDNERPGASTHIILKINVMICIYFVLSLTLAHSHSVTLVTFISLENKVIYISCKKQY